MCFAVVSFGFDTDDALEGGSNQKKSDAKALLEWGACGGGGVGGGLLGRAG